MSHKAPRKTKREAKRDAPPPSDEQRKSWLKQNFTPTRLERRAWSAIARGVNPTAAAIARATKSSPAEAIELRKQLLSNADRRAGRRVPKLAELAASVEEVRAEHSLPYCGGKRFKRALAYTDALIAQQGDDDGSAALAAAEAPSE